MLINIKSVLKPKKNNDRLTYYTIIEDDELGQIIIDEYFYSSAIIKAYEKYNKPPVPQLIRYFLLMYFNEPSRINGIIENNKARLGNYYSELKKELNDILVFM